MNSFKPMPKQLKRDHRGYILIELPVEVYAEVKEASTKSGVSMKEFCRQAIRFSLDSMEQS